MHFRLTSLEASSRLEQITFTRFIAASTVVFFHFAQGIWPIDVDPWSRILRAGPTAVSYFYVLSGFIMGLVYAELKRGEAPRYWLARFARIYPVYLLGIVVYAWLISAGTWTQLILNVSLLQAWVPGYPLTLNGVGWSLSVEILFYALFPFLIGAARALSTRMVCTVVVLAWVATQVWIGWLFKTSYGGFPSLTHDLLFYWPPHHLASFLIGMGIAVLVGRGRLHLGPRAGFVTVALSLLFIGLGLVHEGAISTWLGLRVFGATGLLAPLFAALIVGLFFLNAPILASRPMRLLGEASYALYILQIPVLVFMLQTFPGLTKPASFWIYFGALTAASIAVFAIFETPMRRLIRKLPFASAGLLSSPAGSPTKA